MLNKIWKIIKDPLRIDKVLNRVNMKASMLQGDIHHSTKRTEELTTRFHNLEIRMQHHLFMTQIQEALDSSIPDMFWAKDLEGRYIVANKAIRDKLLFDDDPYGKTDREIAAKIVQEVGEDNHTFGAICGNSDEAVLAAEYPMKFNEDGLVRGRYMMLQVHKNVVRNDEGKIIATCGTGRDITIEMELLNQMVVNSTACSKCSDSKEILDTIMNLYRFEDRE